MKTTGRIELTQADPEFYFIDDIVHYNNIPALHVNNITDIREEVDWSKVKKNTPCMFWNEGVDWRYIGFFGGITTEPDSGKYIRWPVYDALKFSMGEPYYDHAMPLDQWLKEHGGQDE